eukprot:CAMPEP_0116542128 /NCGR_PEP_ID=MMETSP0397-20121206/852_1 /TAXON_ID=216820 /ORGANISM="Cyclophora tenuis, Strain ECT3854" /LENGTH=31 /DNA_ID= /DNA_START= /DNA_END= /DNA_ORIENTATION=
MPLKLRRATEKNNQNVALNEIGRSMIKLQPV